MLVLRIQDIRSLIYTEGLKAFFQGLVTTLQDDYSHWQDFQKSPRYAAYVDNGVVELMPVCGKALFGFKYVNGHPNNPMQNLLNIMSIGMLVEVETGKPLLVSEMTLLTALRTAATAALASSYMARRGSRKLTIIGCGAQSEFQVLAHHALFDLAEVYYYDHDPAAMERFQAHLGSQSFKLIAATEMQEAIAQADIIITATASKKKQQVLVKEWLKPGQHIVGIGGDSPGKTELDPAILEAARVVVEYFPQTLHEGEIQNLGEARAKQCVAAELWELCQNLKAGRETDSEITLFDSVGFALEDYSILRYVYALAGKMDIGLDLDLIPEHITNPKNLFGFLGTPPF